MIRRLIAALPVAGAVGLAVAFGDDRRLSAALLVAASAYIAARCLRLTRRRWPLGRRSDYALALARTSRPASSVADVTRLANAISLSHLSGREYDLRLRPVLYRAARGRLRALGVHLDDPAVAEAAFGHDVWRLVAPVPLERARRDQPGPSMDDLERIIVTLEET